MYYAYNMAIIFKEEGHVYESIESDNIEWLSVTSFIAKFKPKFDRVGQAKKSSKNKRSKWYGQTPKEILAAHCNTTSENISYKQGFLHYKEKSYCSFQAPADGNGREENEGLWNGSRAHNNNVMIRFS